MAGFIKISRDILDWEWYDDPNTFRVFIHLLLNANYEDKKYHGIDIRKGSLVIGRQQLAVDLGISEQNVRTALNHLKSTNEITIKVTSKFSIVTICNFERWQGMDFLTNQQINQQNNQQLTSNQPATNQQLTTTKEIKKERNEEYNNNISTEGVVASTDSEKKPKKRRIIDEEEKRLRQEAKRKFIEKYKSMFGEEYYWEAKDAANLPKLLAKIRFSRKGKELPIDGDSLVDAFGLFLEYVKKNNFLMNNYTVPMLNSQYNAIMTWQNARGGELPGQVMRGEEREYNENNFFER